MSEVKTILTLLKDSLNQKRDALIQLASLTKEQEHILNDSNFEDKAFQRSINNKQKWIDKVILLDEGFKPQFEKISGRLEQNPELYRDDINQMKALIIEVGELGIAIEVAEKRNKVQFDIVTKQSKDKVKTFKKSKKAVSNYYSSMNKQKSDSSSFFFDSKKR